jgi:6-pyruvoyltetrahydropterin/6-carboxytetrahydropterin synthase
MWTISKTFRFEAAHWLTDHDGQCARLHGHSYKLEVNVSQPRLIGSGPKSSMVMDFADLSRIVKNEIVERLDHRLILDRNQDAAMSQNQWALLHMSKVAIPMERTTAECLAKWIAETIGEALEREFERPEYLTVKLWETETGSAEYEL